MLGYRPGGVRVLFHAVAPEWPLLMVAQPFVDAGLSSGVFAELATARIGRRIVRAGFVLFS